MFTKWQRPILNISKNIKPKADEPRAGVRALASQTFNTVTEKAVKEEPEKNAENGNIENHLKVSGDASWKNRGFTSLHGATTLIGHYGGEVIDLIVKSAYCHSCTL